MTRPGETATDTSTLTDPPDARAWTVDDGWARRAATALVRLQVRLVLVAGLLGLAAIGLQLTATRAGRAGPGAYVAAVVAMAVVLGALLVRRRRQAQAHVARISPAGSTIAVALRPDTLWLRTAVSTTEVRYAAFRRVHEHHGVVALRQHSPVVVLLPAQVLPPDGVAELRRRIEGGAGA